MPGSGKSKEAKEVRKLQKIERANLVPSPNEKRFFYKADSSSGRLERHLSKNGIPWIGALDYREKRFMRPDGGIRWGGLDIEPGERAYRTWCIKHLTRPGLEKIHQYENQRMVRFALHEEMEKIAKEKIEKIAFTQAQREHFIEFNNEHRPIFDKKFQGFSVPPYFLYDNEFDGMEYHHAWDMCVWVAEFNMPLAKSSKAIDTFND